MQYSSRRPTSLPKAIETRLSRNSIAARLIQVYIVRCWLKDLRKLATKAPV